MRTITEPAELRQLLKYGWCLFRNPITGGYYIEHFYDGYHLVSRDCIAQSAADQLRQSSDESVPDLLPSPSR